MSVFYKVIPVAQERVRATYIDEQYNKKISNVWHVYLSALARTMKLSDRKLMNNPIKLVEYMRATLSELAPAEVALLLFSSIPNKYLMVFREDKELVAEIIDHLKHGTYDLSSFYQNAESWRTKLHLWQFISLANYFNRDIPGIELMETTLQVGSLVLPEGSMPDMRSSVQWPRWVSRLLRDADDTPNNHWLQEFGYDQMAAASWQGEPIVEVMIYDRKRTSCNVKFMCEPRWVTHIQMNSAFQSAG